MSKAKYLPTRYNYVNVDHIIAVEYRSKLKHYKIIVSDPTKNEASDLAGLFVKEETINKLFNIHRD